MSDVDVRASAETHGTFFTLASSGKVLGRVQQGQEAGKELEELARAARGGAILISPAGDIALARGRATVEAAHLTRATAPWARAWAEQSASFCCDDGTWMHVTLLADGWVLGVQTTLGSDPRPLRDAVRRARRNLVLLLAYEQPPLSRRCLATLASAGTPTVTRLAASWWFPISMGVLAAGCTLVGACIAVRPGRRRVLLAAGLAVATVGLVTCIVGMYAPIFSPCGRLIAESSSREILRGRLGSRQAPYS